jgi:hypothetical protein
MMAASVNEREPYSTRSLALATSRVPVCRNLPILGGAVLDASAARRAKTSRAAASI